jgi:hypothetical protein
MDQGPPWRVAAFKQASSQSQELAPKQHVGWNIQFADVAYVKQDDIEREARARVRSLQLGSGYALTRTGRGGAVRQTSRLFAWAEKDLKIKNMIAWSKKALTIVA